MEISSRVKAPIRKEIFLLRKTIFQFGAHPVSLEWTPFSRDWRAESKQEITNYVSLVKMILKVALKLHVFEFVHNTLNVCLTYLIRIKHASFC